MTGTLGIGIIGCGNISAAYFTPRAALPGLEVRACTDLNLAAAEARAKEFGVEAADRSTRCSPTPTSTSSST